MKKFFFLLLTIVTLVSCRKNTTPSNVTKTIENETWKVARMVKADSNITNSLLDIRLAFGQEFQLVVKAADTTFIGTWEVPQNAKDPAELYLNLSEQHPRSLPLSDDWLVTYRVKKEIHLERLNGKLGASDELILRRL